MNQINLDKLLQLAPNGKADSAALKLMIAQVYQGQIQQLSSSEFRLQLPSPQGPVQISLPASASQALQQLAQSVAPEQLKSTVQQHSLLAQKLAVQVQFQPLPDGQIRLTLQSAASQASLTLQPSQLRQLLLSVYSSQTAATPVKSTDNQSSAALITAQLQTHTDVKTVRLPGLSPLPIAAQAQRSLESLLTAGHARPLTVVLQLHNNDKHVSANLLLSAAQGPGSGIALLDKPRQQALLQQLIQSFNQQQLSTANINQPALTSLKQLITTQTLSPGPHQLQLQPATQGNLSQLQLIPLKNQLKIAITPQDSNRPLQFVAPGQTDKAAVQTQRSDFILPQAVQQAWRHLLPLLSSHAEPLATLPELPQPVQQILQQVRQSQPDGRKVITPNQLMIQLQSLLQFQPLQANANVQTTGGALAVAIQLLLGHLLQKPQNAAHQPANQKLAQLVNALEPAQASNLLRQLASHSSVLQQSQLATLDSNQATQQHLLLQLPLQQGEQSVFSQIQLEQREADGKQPDSKQTQWQLTMRFDLQQLGPLLVVAKLQQQQLQLQFYTEQAQTKQLADRFLPILKDRCNMQGLVVSEADCVLGKIPDTLLPRANSLLAIKV